MTTAPRFSESERAIYAELATCIALDMSNPVHSAFCDGVETSRGRVPGRGVAGDMFEHHFMQAFGRACVILWRMDIVEALRHDDTLVDVSSLDKRSATRFRMKCDVGEVKNRVAALLASDQSGGELESERPPSLGIPSLDEMLQAFVGLASHFGLLTTSRMAFQPLPEYREAMRQLAQAGYAEASGDLYSWADQAKPAMVAIVEWNEAGESFEDIEEDFLESEAEAALRAIPDDIRQFFQDNPDDLMLWHLALSTRWKDGQWQEACRDQFTTGPGTVLARRVMAKFKIRYCPGSN